jgi:PmbA protein
VLGEERLRGMAETVLGLAEADQTEVVITTQDLALTRFAANRIHQNVAETDVNVRVRSVIGKRIGVAAANDLEEGNLIGLVRKAETAAKLQQENPEFRSLPEPQPIQMVDAVSESTAVCTPQLRADGVEAIVRQAKAKRLDASGAFSTSADELMIANSLGTRAYHAGTTANVMSVIMGASGSGYAADVSWDVEDIEPAEVGRIAVDKALRGADPVQIEPGEYTVILEEAAVANMLFFLGYLGLGALAVQEGRSFMSGRFGEKVTGDAITIWDDGLDPRGLPLPFDFEGIPRQKLSLIENGVAKNVAYDSFTAGRETGKRSTGHALAAPNVLGPIPIHLFMAPGSATVEEMIASTERGIWVTRFHYTNPVHPVKTILTGMTRDGTFLIENGKIAKPLKNLRFTQSILEAFENVEALGRDAKRVQAGFGNIATVVPVAKISGFRFTGTTEF